MLPCSSRCQHRRSHQGPERTGTDTPTTMPLPPDGPRMAETDRLRRRLDDQAVGCVLNHLHESRRNGRLLFPLADLAEETSLNPNTVDGVMRLLERTGPFVVEPVENGYGETRWTVEGSAYELDGWTSEAWNAPSRLVSER